MKRAELLTHAKCHLCNKPIGHSGLPLFWKVTVERYGVDLRAVQRQDALGTFVGSQILGAVMGPDEDLAKPMMDKPAIATVCETCGTGKEVMVAMLAEVSKDDSEAAGNGGN
jgi:hypothetical protein